MELSGHHALVESPSLRASAESGERSEPAFTEASYAEAPTASEASGPYRTSASECGPY